MENYLPHSLSKIKKSKSPAWHSHSHTQIWYRLHYNFLILLSATTDQSTQHSLKSSILVALNTITMLSCLRALFPFLQVPAKTPSVYNLISCLKVLSALPNRNIMKAVYVTFPPPPGLLLGPHLKHMEVPRLGGLIGAVATSLHSSQQHWILNPLS